MALLNIRTNADPDGVNQYGAEFADLRTADAERINRMSLYRRENEDARKTNLLAKIQQPDTRDYGRAQRRRHDTFRHDIPLPLGKALTVKHSYRISGRLPDAIVDRRDESPEERYRSDTMEKIVWAIMRASRGNTQFASGSWDGSELGSTVFDLYYDVKRQLPIFRAVDPIGLVVVPGVDDPHEFQRVYRSWDVPLASLRAEYKDDPTVRLQEITKSHMAGTIEMVTIAQMCDEDQRVRFIPHCGVKLEEETHSFGFVPYVVIPNVGPDRDIWGWADYEFVRAITAYLGALFSREADILRSVANGTYIEKGTGQNPELIRATLTEGGVIPSKRDGDLQPVDPPQVPQFAEAHADRAMAMFKMLGFAPDATWGLGRYTSGSEHGLSLQPFVEFTAMKQLNWEAGLGRLFDMAYRMIEKKLVGNAKYRGSKPGPGNRRLPFVVNLGSNMDPLKAQNPSATQTADPGAADLQADDLIDLPRTPAALFDGDYEVRFIWNNRIDPDDPSYILAELNKFQHGAQSLETTLERLGFEAPQDEIRRIEQEAELYPWLNNGMIALIRAQLSQSNQGDGGGNPGSATADLSQGTATAGSNPALGADAGAQGLGAGASAPMYGGA